MEFTHLRTCNLCEATCGVAIRVEGERILSIRGDREDPFSRGYICPKAVGLKDIYEDPDRLRVPQRRLGDRWVEIGWDEALDEAASRLREVQRIYGRDAIGIYQGNPSVHNLGTMIFGQHFARRLGTRNRYSATSLDQLPHMLAAWAMFGHQLLLPVPDVDRSDFILILGANPVASNGSLMTAPGIGDRLRAIQARGGRVVVVDPRRTETADLADTHLFIRPGSDAMLLFALIGCLFEQNCVSLGRLAPLVDPTAIEVLHRTALPFSPERVASATGIEGAVIRKLASDFASAPSAVCYGRVGVSTQEFGGLCAWLIYVLNILTGNLDRAGGAMFTTPAVDPLPLAARIGQSGHFGRRKSRVRGLPEFGGEYPTAALAEEIDTPGPGQIRALVTSAGNPVLSAPNGPRLERGLAGLEFMLAIDFYRNETTRHADLILPPTTNLERDHYDLVFNLLAVRNVAKYSPALFLRPAEARHDWEIYLGLARRLGRPDRGRQLYSRLEERLLSRIGVGGVIDAGLRFGPYGGWRRGRRPGLSLSELKKHPHGLDLGPLKTCLPDRLFTPDRRIVLAPTLFLADVDRLRACLDRPIAVPSALSLIGRRDLRTNNSWMHNSYRLVKGRNRCTLLIHPTDAATRGLVQNQRVAIRSRIGMVEAELEICESVMPGIVCLPHGWGHHRPGLKLSIAERHARVSLNDLTDELAIDALSGNTAFSGLEVTVGPSNP